MSSSHQKKIGVLYLARIAEGPAPFSAFKDSYLNSAPGVDHELVVVFKENGDSAATAAARSVFADIPHVAVVLPDEGFDIGAYLAAASHVGHEYLCCINTFTKLHAPGWLAGLHRNISEPNVGIVGATASYESIYDSMRLLNFVIWLCRHDNIRFDPKIAAYFDFLLNEHCKEWLANGLAKSRRRTWLKSIIRNFKQRRRARKRWPILRGHLEERWKALTAEDQPMSRLLRFPSFPNPHVRSNGFMVRREHLLSAWRGEIADKLDACEFESGENSLTWQLRRQGLRALLVDRDGRGFDVADWWRSRTFRLQDQRGLLMSDNRTRDFDAMSPAEKATHVWMTWGDYLGAPPRDLPRLGLSFPVDRSRTGP